MRDADINRGQKMVVNRFPELNKAREAFLGPENKLPKKQAQATDVVEFSNMVEKLAMEEEPHQARLQMSQT